MFEKYDLRAFTLSRKKINTIHFCLTTNFYKPYSRCVSLKVKGVEGNHLNEGLRLIRKSLVIQG